MTSRPPPLLKSVPLAIALGAVCGAGWGAYVVGQAFGWGWGAVAAAVGLLLGAIAGLDLLLPGPTRSTFDETPQAGPFRSAVYFAGCSVAGFVAALFAVGELTCDCQRRETGEVDCLRVATVWLGTQRLAENEYRDVREVIETVHGDTWVHLGDGTSAGLASIPPQPLQEFLTSAAPALHIANRSLTVFPWIFGGIGVVCGLLAISTVGWAMRLLRTELAKSRRRSATGL